jgi:tRNA-2-methylthio-N6-dimethylallyladenosine synthase
VLNVCSVRKSAVDRIAGNFKKYKKFKEKNPNFRTVITGCVLESDREKFEKLFDLVVDIKDIEKLPKMLNVKTKSENEQIYNINDYFQIAPKHQSKITAYAPIMTGCNNFCSYCVVPYTRGRENSRPAEEILDEVKNLVETGYKEIILLGQNVNSYKSQIPNTKYQINFISKNLKQMSFLSRNNIRDKLQQEFTATLNAANHTNFNNKSNPTNWILASAGMTQSTELINFPELLKLINSISGNFWIRFLTSHPKDMTEELIKTVADCEKCAEHIHLALQSGDDEILEKMNRKYTAKHYLELIKLIRKYIPNVAISTDVIVGFPGETKKQFQNTAKVMKEAKFDMAYLNKYSLRTGTASAKLKDNVSWKEKKNREDILNKVLRKTALENNQKYVGEVVEVLIDESRIMNYESRIFYGKTRSFKNVKIGLSIKYPVLSIKQRQFVKIKITKAEAWGLEG